MENLVQADRMHASRLLLLPSGRSFVVRAAPFAGISAGQQAMHCGRVWLAIRSPFRAAWAIDESRTAGLSVARSFRAERGKPAVQAKKIVEWEGEGDDTAPSPECCQVSFSPTEFSVLPMPEPTVVAPPISRTDMRAAIKPYSIAVAPLSSLMNRTISFI
mgnify:CR=1 FL=1